MSVRPSIQEAIRRRAEMHPDRLALASSGWSYARLWSEIRGRSGETWPVRGEVNSPARRLVEPESIARVVAALQAGGPVGALTEETLTRMDAGFSRAFKIGSGAVVAMEPPSIEDPVSLALALFALAAGATLFLFAEASASAPRASIAVLPFRRLGAHEIEGIDLAALSILAIRIESAAPAEVLERFLEVAERQGLRRRAVMPFYASPTIGIAAASPKGAGPTFAAIDAMSGRRFVTAGPLLPGVDRGSLPGELVIHEGELVVLGEGAPELSREPGEPAPRNDRRGHPWPVSGEVNSPAGASLATGSLRGLRPCEPAQRRDVSAAEIEAWLTAWIAAETQAAGDEIDPEASFRDLGLNSANEVLMSAELERWLGRSLSPTLTWDHPSVARLAEHLVRGEER